MNFLKFIKNFWFLFIGLILIIIIGVLPKNSTPENKVYKNTNHEYPTKICVYVTGEVVVTGKMYFYAQDTVLDLVRASGLTDYTNTSSVKLDETLKDGTTYDISIVSDNEKTINIANKTTQIEIVDSSSSSNIAANGNVDSEGKDTRIDINSATLEELKTLPGIGEARAKKIIEYREKNKFSVVSDLMKVDGISESIYEKLSNYITCK